MNTLNFNDLYSFMELMEKLKTTSRTGWVQCSIDQPESIADHIFRMCIMALILTPPDLDSSRVIRLILIHDLGESIIGDIATTDTSITKSEKQTMERAAIQELADLVQKPEITELYKEFESRSTPESQFAKNLDTLEMMFQADHYQNRYPDRDLSEFWDWAQTVDFGRMTDIFNQLKTHHQNK